MTFLPFVTESASSLAKKIRTREASSVEIVEAHLAVLLRDNPRLNVVVETRLAAARREAREADARVAREPTSTLPPLLGVPCSIKETFGLTGMHQTGGLRSRTHVRATSDAVAVARLREAGAIVLGTTNVSELCMWMESENRVYGRTNNPYDDTRGVGGSSGGEGAAVGAGFAPFGLGADIGGSIRIPAFMNGVFGHKPTGGLIPNAGQYPVPGPDAMRMLTSGPITRRAEDLWPLVRLLSGPTSLSPEVLPIELGDPSEVSIEGLRVIDVADNGVSRVDPSLVRAQRRLADHLASRGARVERVAIPALRKSVLIWSAMLAAGGSEDFAVLLGGGRRIGVTRELVRLLAGRSDFTGPSLVLAAIEEIPKHFPGNAREMVAEGLALRRELEDRIGDGVMLYPGYSAPAPKHRRPWAKPIDWAYTAIFNVLEMPGTQVPLGLGPEGVPLGCQVIAPRRMDHRTVAIALEAERAFGGWVPPVSLRASPPLEQRV
ncbi:MAG: amidase [Deltaproteobacteria bacterium]|nr:amidase [Deltaproteobacteria bacterium]